MQESSVIRWRPSNNCFALNDCKQRGNNIIWCNNKWQRMMMMIIIIHHGHKILSHAKLWVQSWNLGVLEQPCFNLDPPLSIGLRLYCAVVMRKCAHALVKWYVARSTCYFVKIFCKLFRWSWFNIFRWSHVSKSTPEYFRYFSFFRLSYIDWCQTLSACPVLHKPAKAAMRYTAHWH